MKKNDFKSISQKISGYTKVKVTQEDLYNEEKYVFIKMETFRMRN